MKKGTSVIVERKGFPSEREQGTGYGPRKARISAWLLCALSKSLAIRKTVQGVLSKGCHSHKRCEGLKRYRKVRCFVGKGLDVIKTSSLHGT
jgi:hypothetical protein